MCSLPAEFSQFISQDCNRRLFLQQWLTELNIPFSNITIEDTVHICVQFPQSAYNPLFKIKTILVHYDRALIHDTNPPVFSPGANDNSAAVYQVMLFVRRLLTNPAYRVHNMRIFFTDGEELCSGSQSQGAYGLALLFKKFGITSDDVIVVDGCGRGDVLVVSTAGKDSPAPFNFTKRFNSLYNRICSIAREIGARKWVTLPVPYSDNAGFLAAGIPAVALTVLPSKEVSIYLRQLQKDSKFSEKLRKYGLAIHGAGLADLNGAHASEVLQNLRNAGIDPAEALLLSEKLPLTWRMMHTEHDNLAQLNKEAFALMAQFLDKLAETRTLA